MICTQCGAQMRQTGKNTFTGRVIRDYECPKCGHADWQDEGIALWQVMHDAREQDKAEAAARAAADAEPSQPETASPGPNPQPSLWRRLTERFRAADR